MATIQINGATNEGRSVIISPQRTVNLYAEPLADGQNIALVGVPGMSVFSTVSSAASATIRGTRVMNGVLYVVAGDSLYSVATTGVATLIHALASSTGLVYMTDNNVTPGGGNQLFIVDGTYGYIYNVNTTTWTQLSNGANGFPSAGATTCTMIDGYFVVSEAGGGGRFWVSNLLDGITWNPLNIAASQSSPNSLLRVISFAKQLWLFGNDVIEPWYDSGYGNPPFSAVYAGTWQLGTAAAGSIVDAGFHLIWLSRAKTGACQVLASAMGGVPQPISTPDIEYAINQMTTISDAVGMFMFFEGHNFYVLNFPTGNLTVVYDFVTKMWHIRSSWSATSGITPNVWAVQNHIFFNNQHYMGSSSLGVLYLLSSSKYTDNGNPIVSYRQTQAISSEKDYVFFASLELEMETGVGLDGYGSQEGDSSSVQWGGGINPQIMLQWSDDGGQSWGSEHWLTIGRMGEYGKRVLWRRLGKSRNRVFRYVISDPVKKVIRDGVIHYEKVFNASRSAA